jgi:hypothetical protein
VPKKTTASAQPKVSRRTVVIGAVQQLCNHFLENCLSYFAKGVCAHIIAACFKMSKLPHFLRLSSNAEVAKGAQNILADQISKDKHAIDLLKKMF